MLPSDTKERARNGLSIVPEETLNVERLGQMLEEDKILSGAGAPRPVLHESPEHEEEERESTVEETLQTKAGFPIIVTKNDESRNTERHAVRPSGSFEGPVNQMKA